MATDQEIIDDLVLKRRASIVLPAGCGKTELLAKVVTNTSGRALVLTHTHAGVRAIRQRLLSLGASQASYRVVTIAAWALEYASRHPSISQFRAADRDINNWVPIYRGAQRVVERPLGRLILSRSYARVLVDEYQDCTREQHALILALADCLPCHVVGDPLQSIFGFREDEIIEWPVVQRRFPDYSYECIPWRWRNVNPPLGEWLLAIRRPLELGQSIEIPDDVEGLWWEEDTPANRRRACFRSLNTKAESVLVICPVSNVSHSLSRSIGRAFTSMDERERRDLFLWARNADNSSTTERVVALGVLAQKCMTNIPAAFKQDLKAISAGLRLPRLKSNDPARSLLRRSLEESKSVSLSEAYGAISPLGRHVYRKDLWFDIGRVIRIFEEGPYETVVSAAQALLRSRVHEEQLIPKRVMSRTLLMKGLEFDHVVIIGTDNLDTENLYVALTRARQQVTILSKSRTLSPARAQKAPPQMQLGI